MMAESDEINKLRKCKLSAESGIFVLASEDHSSLNSSHTISSQITDDELIILDSSQESTGTCDNDPNDLSVSGPSNFEETLAPGVAPPGFILLDEDVDDDASNPEVQQCNSADVSEPVFKVMFRDETIARNYQRQIRDFLQGLISSNPEDDNCKYSNLILEIWDHDVVTKRSTVNVTAESKKRLKSLDDTLFVVDTQPTLKHNVDVPTYRKKFERVFEKSEAELKQDIKENCPQKVACFNCLGNHNLRDCTAPRNHANIHKNRRNFTVKQGPKYARYHLDDDQKFGHLVPGQLSKDLRVALGLRDNELPRHIYRMRMLGYPPGWLEEARLQHSGLTLFNSDGTAELDPHEEHGEIIDKGARDQFDVKKIFDYPGFNVPPPPGTRDDCQHHYAPQMQVAHSKETMLFMLNGRKADEGYKRKKMKVRNDTANTDATISSSEMDIVEVEDGIVESIPVNGLFIPPLPKDVPLRPPEPPSEDSDSQSQEPRSPDSVNESTAPSSRANSPSLSDLECAKKQLLAELDDSSSQSNSSTPVKGKLSGSVSSVSNTEMLPPSTDVTPQTNRTRSARTTPNTNYGSVKSVDLGTPILQSTSPYNKLPASDNFSKNICDVIHFDNLPDSTGKYEQMSGIIRKVRNVVTKIQQE